MRCTQNPTRGEEWRRDWHPETIAPRHDEETVLVVGGGPAGLEAARALGLRGYDVTLAEATTDLGGRVTRESALPGLSAWARVRDYRLQQLHKLDNVEIYLDSRLAVEQVLEFGFAHVCIATGAHWRRDGRGRFDFDPIAGWPHDAIVGVDAVMADAKLEGPVVVYDDDHFYMGGVIAEKLRAAGHEVLLVTSASALSPNTAGSLEQDRIQAQALALGIELLVSHKVTAFHGDGVTLTCVYSGKQTHRPCAAWCRSPPASPTTGSTRPWPGIRQVCNPRGFARWPASATVPHRASSPPRSMPGTAMPARWEATNGRPRATVW